MKCDTMAKHKRIKIAENDDLEYFHRRLAIGIELGDSNGFLPGTNGEKYRHRVMTQTELANITYRMANQNFRIIDVEEFKLAAGTRFVEFLDEATFVEFMLLM